jgi:hypothetical protein
MVWVQRGGSGATIEVRLLGLEAKPKPKQEEARTKVYVEKKVEIWQLLKSWSKRAVLLLFVLGTLSAGIFVGFRIWPVELRIWH